MKNSSIHLLVYMKGGIFIYKCSLCGNEDEKYIGYRNGKPYCRRCINFIGEPVDDSVFIRDYKGSFTINYSLSKEQKEVSNKALNNFKNGKDTLIYAVCGAGKTELVFESIHYALSNKLTVGFAIPRRDVVIELAFRLQNTFKKYKVISVYGGNTDNKVGDIICLTTHQLFRYEKYFDLLILDEIDACPFKGNYVLNALFRRSIKGNYIMMTATPSKEILDEFRNGKDKELLELYVRYHHKPIPVPVIKRSIKVLLPFIVVKNLLRFKSLKKPLLIFVPTINYCEKLYNFIKIFAKSGNFVHSKRIERSQIIEDFKNKKYDFLVTTAVLERGVTIKNLQVIIYKADNDIFTKEGLIQISGRVGRVIGATSGEIIYISETTTKAMKDSIDEINRANRVLQNMLQRT